TRCPSSFCSAAPRCRPASPGPRWRTPASGEPLRARLAPGFEQALRLEVVDVARDPVRETDPTSPVDQVHREDWQNERCIAVVLSEADAGEGGDLDQRVVELLGDAEGAGQRAAVVLQDRHR